jgi:hypothetical protein
MTDRIWETHEENNMRLMKIEDSKNIDAVGYDAKTMQVGIVFKSSPDVVYKYDCSDSEFLEFIGADSMGNHVHAVFRKRAFTKSARERPTLEK